MQHSKFVLTNIFINHKSARYKIQLFLNFHFCLFVYFLDDYLIYLVVHVSVSVCLSIFLIFLHSNSFHFRDDLAFN